MKALLPVHNMKGLDALHFIKCAGIDAELEEPAVIYGELGPHTPHPNALFIVLTGQHPTACLLAPHATDSDREAFEAIAHAAARQVDAINAAPWN